MQAEANCPLSVYRYIPIHRLWQILSNKSLYFIRNTKWDDPFEGFLLKRYCQDTGINYQTLMADKFFLCCTKPFERDHFWRNYTPNKNGVAVRLKTNWVINLDGSIKCRSVIYPKKDKIHNALRNLKNVSNDKIINMLFIKRLAFEPEKEVRFLIQKEQAEEEVAVPMKNPNEVIEAIIFDPRMDWCTFKAHEKFIEKEFGDYKIARSDLYDPERIFPPYAQSISTTAQSSLATPMGQTDLGQQRSKKKLVIRRKNRRKSLNLKGK